MDSPQKLPLPTKRRWSFLSIAVLLLMGLAQGRIAGIAQTGQQLDSNAILGYVNQVIGWYRRLATGIQPPGLPLDPIYQSNLQDMATQTVRVAIQAAKAEAALIPSSGRSAGQTGNAGAAGQNIQKIQNDVNASITALQGQIAALNEQIAKTSKRKASGLLVQKDQLQGELDLTNERRTAVEQLSKFIGLNTETGEQDLLGKINELERSVPELNGTNPPARKTTPAQVANPKSQGLIGKAVLIYDELQCMRQIDDLAAETSALSKSAEALRTPLQTLLRSTIQQGQQLASANPAVQQSGQEVQKPSGQNTPSQQTSAPTSQAAAMRKQFETLIARFKQLSAAAVPLSQEIILLDQSHSELMEWHDYIYRESQSTLHAILFQVAWVLFALGVVLGLSEMWRRVTFRYVRDLRRRRQFLLLRRVIVGFCMGLVLILGFANEFSSLATFAGFITAGLAVGLQTILLSVAAYFFLVGKWGIRVGDRISVAGVTGEVVDVGLVRLYLMEMAGTGIDLFPTGRIVVFANSVLFQATTPLFKQFPGADLTWHEVAVALQGEANYKLVEEKLLQAVQAVYLEYRPDFERQHGNMERNIDIALKMPEPQGRLQLADTGLEYAVRYPVGLEQGVEVDEKVTRKLLELVEQTPDLKTAIAGLPKIRTAVKT